MIFTKAMDLPSGDQAIGEAGDPGAAARWNHPQMGRHRLGGNQKIVVPHFKGVIELGRAGQFWRFIAGRERDC